MTIWQVDAFAEKAFAGNPAGVCVLGDERPDSWMQAVAQEMNLSETAFVRRVGDTFSLRWFTPKCEVELCGHATLATAHVLWEQAILRPQETAEFSTQSGPLRATRSQGLIELDFPARAALPAPSPPGMLEALAAGGPALAPVYTGADFWLTFYELASEAEVRRLTPDFGALARAGSGTALVTARGSEHDFVSRFFAPGVGIDEDPVTGSAHCYLAPYWAARLGKDRLVARQVSARGGTLYCRPAGDRVLIGGRAVTVLEARLFA